MDSNPISIPNLCGWCGGAATCRCGRCHGVYYCSNEHQMQHWAIHKKSCKESLPPGMPLSNMIFNMSSTSNISHSMPSTSNIIHNMSSASSISHNVPSASTISHNIPSASISLNIPSTSNISLNMPVSNISHNMTSMNINHNLPSSNISHNLPSNINMPSASNLFSTTANWNQSNVPTHINEGINNLPSCSNVFNTNNSCISSAKPLDFNIACADEILSSLGNDLLSSDNSFWNLIDTCDAQNISDLDLYLGKDVTNQVPASQHPSTASNVSHANSPSLINDEDVNLIECASLSDICKNVIHDLNTYGICVLDKFIGSRRGNSVLDEVKSLYSTGVFEKGKLVKTSAYIASESIRSDVTTWVDGTEPSCPNIGYLIQKLDLVMATCNKMPNNGQLSKYKLHRRTKAMVACYPGNRTHYKKHVDNPNKDGRCITCIYYLNQNWDVKKHGGMLRMFPSARDSDVAQIAPIFDRMLFFWSDRRNPHEVLPALAMRFAITVWYFDADEREAALKAAQEKGQLSQSS